MTTPLALLALYVLCDAVRDSNRDHGTFGGWWYGQNRWRHKYAREPYNWSNQKWWAKIGLTSFIDLWHALKTIQVILLVLMAVLAVGLDLYWVPILWVAYGTAFTVIYNAIKEN